VDVNPYQALGVSPTATAAEITAAYRTMAQLFHPDRYAEAPENVRREAERRMKELNDAYDFARKATPVQTRLVHSAERRQRMERKKSAQSTNFGVPWEVAQRERAEQSARAHAARMAREQAAHNGKAIARPKPSRQHPSTLSGLGEALHTNKVVCRRCRSIEWLPAGWSDRLDELDFFCSVCDRLLISRRFAG
jgi:hypothetical protein